MAGSLSGDPSHHGTYDGAHYKQSQEKPEEVGGRWYLSRKEIEENSPSRRDGIDLKKETYLRKSYCTFLQDLGMRLKVPQVTIATAIIFCHRFFLRQSHAKNERRTIATVCMFLAGKVEETPRPLKDVIQVSYDIIHKKDPEAAQRIKQKEVYEQQKELILVGERVVLATLGFDFNVFHPYKPLVEAIKKFKVAQNALAQVAWNFVNDGLRTSLCLQFKPHHIAAGAIFLAAKFLKVKLPSDGEKVWWQEFDVTPRQLEEVSNQMLELYEQNRVPPSQGSGDAEPSAGAGAAQRHPSKTPPPNEDHPTHNNYSNHSISPKNENNDRKITDIKREINDYPNEEAEPLRNVPEIDGNTLKTEPGEAAGDSKDKNCRNFDYKDTIIGQSPQDAIKKIDKDKVKAALEKRRKARGDVTKKMDFMDEDDLIERELEDGIELAVKTEQTSMEEGELGLEESERGVHRSPMPPKSGFQKRKAGGSPPADGHDFSEDRSRGGKIVHSERDHKRQMQENHV